jgi:hypothetical protein
MVITVMKSLTVTLVNTFWGASAGCADAFDPGEVQCDCGSVSCVCAVAYTVQVPGRRRAGVLMIVPGSLALVLMVVVFVVSRTICHGNGH